MSEPFRHREKKIYGAISEIVSGLSCLHSYPEPIPMSEEERKDKYQSETDVYIKHSIEHFHAAIDSIAAGLKDIQAFTLALYKIADRLVDAGESEPGYAYGKAIYDLLENFTA
jgi:hypothetical protein